MPNFGDIAASFKLSATRAAADLSDLPTPSSGVITLLADIYEIKGNVDLAGNRIVLPDGCSIIGTGSLTSTGLDSSTALITSTGSVLLRDFTFLNVGKVFDLNGSGTTQFQSINVKYSNCTTIGTIKNYQLCTLLFNFFNTCGGLTYDGTMGSIQHLSNAFIVGSATTMITGASTLTITSRFIIDNSGFSVPSGSTAMNFSTSATIGVDSLYVISTNFTGSGTYLSGVTSSDNKMIAIHCKGITNSGVYGSYYVEGNASANTISVAGTYVKANGTTTAGSDILKFTTPTDNRLTYVGSSQVVLRFVAMINMSAGNNKEVRAKFAKNGSTVSGPPAKTTSSGTGDVSNFILTSIITLNTNDYVELFVTNQTDTTSVTVSDYQVVVEQINN